MTKEETYSKLDGDTFKLYSYLCWKIKQCGGRFSHSNIELINELSIGNTKFKDCKKKLQELGLIVCLSEVVNENNSVKKSRTIYIFPEDSKVVKRPKEDNSKVVKRPKPWVARRPVNYNYINNNYNEGEVNPTPSFDIDGGGINPSTEEWNDILHEE